MPLEQRVGHRLKLRELRILMEVVKAGSMGKAADRLNVSQPVISKAIASLEHTLGVRLLDRNIRGVELTDYGQAALKCGVAVFDDLKKGIEEIEFIADPTVGAVRVGCTEPEFAGIVSAVIDRLSPRYPRIAFHLVRVDQFALYRELEARDVDLVIARLVGPVSEDHVNAEVLYTEPIVVAVGLQSPWARRRRVDLAELVDEPWLLPPPGSFVSSFFADAFCACGLRPPRAAVVSSSTDMRIALLASGRFLTVVPGGMLQISARRLSIKALPVNLLRRQRPVGIITLNGRSLSPAAQLFIECTREVAKPLAPSQAPSGRGKRSNASARSPQTR
jgi:DNA-binding transcriptional LysR family regulator